MTTFLRKTKIFYLVQTLTISKYIVKDNNANQGLDVSY